MTIRTKIVATVGPASGSVPVIRRLVRAGCDVFRINFSHGDETQRAGFLKNIRSVEKRTRRPLAVMADLCGPKIRVGPITGGAVLLATGHQVAIHRRPIQGRADRISTTLPELVDKLRPGKTILLDDGRIRLKVMAARSRAKVICRVVQGGVLAGGKGVNLPGAKLRLSALTEKDRRDVKWIAAHDIDYVALSFVRSAGDVRALRRLLTKARCGAHIIAKIEKLQAMKHIEQIIDAADGIMVARGDLGAEMTPPDVPIAQKEIAHLCQVRGKPCIIATQMLESMISQPTPTRAEVSDVANAVWDLADAVMLSGETAVGRYPVKAAAMMNDIVGHVQAYHDRTASVGRVTFAPARTAAALAAAVRQIIIDEDIAAVAVFTLTGTTALMFAKNRLPLPILALSPNPETVRRMCLYYGVAAVMHTRMPQHTREILATASKCALRHKIVRRGRKIIVVSGRPLGKPGCTNTLVVHTVR